jgi:hypothetical protein
MTPATMSAITGALLAVHRQRTPGTPAGDADDPDEDNTFDLPNGNLIRRKLKQFAKRQLKKILGQIPEIGAPLPDHFPPLVDWTKPMTAAMTPLISLYWDEAGKTTRARLGLDPDAWEVYDPHLHEMIRKASFKFCDATNRTTSLRLDEALEQLRLEFLGGLVDRGDTIPQLTARVQSVFGDLATWRAEMIGRTEASRAVHAASLQSAKESGVVAGKKWLTSANSCEKCVAKAQEYNGTHGIPLDASFGHTASQLEEYAECPGPPLHPHCRCSITYVLTEEYTQALADYPPGSDYRPGSLGPDPKTSPPKRPRAKPAKKEWEVGTPIDPGKPIGERIAAAAHLEEKRKKIASINYEDIVKELEKEKDLLYREMKVLAETKSDYFNTPEYSKLQQQGGILNAKIKKARSDLATELKKEINALLAIDPGKRAVWENRDGEGFSGMTNNRKTRDSVTQWLTPKIAGKASDGKISISWESKKSTRAFANKAQKKIVVKDYEKDHTMIHEMGHHIEFWMPGAEAAAREFLAHRVGSEPLRKLKDVLPQSNYDFSEKGRKDEFDKVFGANAWYVGKHYDSGATEIISMGVEKLYTDPVGFARKDPEYFKFILGILDGSMR